ncbi:MAG: TraI/MobA(P) family conjugative relaxase [Pseudomonadota bacterium]
MIVKKVKNPKKSASKAARVGRLVDYIHAPEKDNAFEKCLYAGARGFLSSDYHAQRAEMLALSQEAVRSRDTINHYVLSWQEGEEPNARQVEEAVDIFLHELGLDEHQAMYGLHVDTANVHLHIAVNRVHPMTLKVVKPNRGFDIEAAHRAVARIEDKQGWRREGHGRYKVQKDSGVIRDVARQQSREPQQPKRDMEMRTGEKSAERISIETGAPLMLAATNWTQLHHALAAKGMRYEKVGSGAVVFVNDVGVKASRADRNASLGKMEKRLGPFESARVEKVAPHPREPLAPRVDGWESYIALRHAHYQAKDTVWRAMRERQEREREAMARQHKQARDDVLQGRWKGRGALRSAFESVLAAQRASAKLDLRDRQRVERGELRAMYPAFPDFERWLREQSRPDLAERWRYRAASAQEIVGDRVDPPRPRDIRDFKPVKKDDVVHYLPSGGTVAVLSPAFVDKGDLIEVNAWRERAGVVAAFQLADEKWEEASVIRGNARFIALCVEVAAEHNFKIANPELQESLQQARARAALRRSRTTQQGRLHGPDRIQGGRQRVDAIPPIPAGTDANVHAYASHFRDIAVHYKEQKLDLWRLDAMVALRMRITGHSPDEIESTLRTVAPVVHQQEPARDWDHYAKRTTAHAFGPAGDRQLPNLAIHRERWLLVERKVERKVERDHENERGGMSR